MTIKFDGETNAGRERVKHRGASVETRFPGGLTVTSPRVFRVPRNETSRGEKARERRRISHGLDVEPAFIHPHIYRGGNRRSWPGTVGKMMKGRSKGVR